MPHTWWLQNPFDDPEEEDDWYFTYPWPSVHYLPIMAFSPPMADHLPFIFREDRFLCLDPPDDPLNHVFIDSIDVDQGVPHPDFDAVDCDCDCCMENYISSNVT
jgi:hypothetical protein